MPFDQIEIDVLLLVDGDQEIVSLLIDEMLELSGFTLAVFRIDLKANLKNRTLQASVQRAIERLTRCLVDCLESGLASLPLPLDIVVHCSLMFFSTRPTDHVLTMAADAQLCPSIARLTLGDQQSTLRQERQWRGRIRR